MSFRFSPRENRAHEILWNSWGQHAFERAKTEHKPILLSISAIWCHWCHVMDETTYSNPEIIARINELYVPVRIDNDERPDINARYNMGGWPTTAFLTPDGKLMTGATYLPPQQMSRALVDIAKYFTEHADEIALQPDRSKMSKLDSDATRQSLDATPVLAVLDDASSSFDPEYGGFGEAPKFPHVDLLELLLQRTRSVRDERAAQMLTLTLRGMSNAGTYDHVEGGFFRYSTTRDWSVPHFEKMAEDHAGLLRVLAGLVVESRDERFLATLQRTTHYIQTQFLDPTTHFFAGSQDADEVYFGLASEARVLHGAPYIDRTSYTNWTLGLASAFFACALTLEDPTLTHDAMATLDAVHERLRDDQGLLYHVLRAEEPPSVRGLLTDQVAYLRALLDAYEYTGEHRFRERAEEMARRICEHFIDETGAAIDHLAYDEDFGRLALTDHPLTENSHLAEALLRLQTITQREQPVAWSILCAFAPTAGQSGIFAASYARALERALAPATHVQLEGSSNAELRELRFAALRLQNPFVGIATTLTDLPQARALPCRGTACGKPVHDARLLANAFATLP